MYYKSRMPEVKGYFDADALSERIETVVSEVPNADSVVIETSLCSKRPYGLEMCENVGVQWKPKFRPKAFTDQYTDGNINNIQRVSTDQVAQEIDSWHADETNGDIIALPEILTTASRFPTEWLVGKVSLDRQFFCDTSEFFWDTDEGQAAIKDALEKGDVEPIHFEAGEVLLAPSGALHRRDIPEEAEGYRYFMRQFPKLNILHGGTYRGLMRPF